MGDEPPPGRAGSGSSGAAGGWVEGSGRWGEGGGSDRGLEGHGEMKAEAAADLCCGEDPTRSGLGGCGRAPTFPFVRLDLG